MPEARRIFLTGFMGAGKTTVGRLLARELGLAFADTDTHITLQSGMSIEAIFDREEEAGFRRRERKALRWAAALENVVVATGGGAVLDPDNRELLRQAGVVVHLQVTAAEARRRAMAGRPLLQGADDSKVETLLAQRRDAYAGADLTIDTTGISARAVAASIRAGLGLGPRIFPPQQRVLPVQVGQGSYQVFLGHRIYHECLRQAVTADRVAVVADTAVWTLYGQELATALEAAGVTFELLLLPGREESKSPAVLGMIHDFLASNACLRDTPLLAVGGGVIGDVGGFAATTYMRGIPLIQIPTTLLAQVDASVGGKVGINHPRGKNLIGAFHQPRACIADQGTLLSLPQEQFSAGLAEVVKAALLDGEDFLTLLEQQASGLLQRDLPLLTRVVERSVAVKAGLVKRDERDHGVRMLLNLGHTLAHALEQASDYTLAHGHAVAVGLGWAARLSEVLTPSAAGLADRVRQLLAALAVPTRIQAPPPAAVLLQLMRMDKKARSTGLQLILLERPGRARVVQDVADDLILRTLEQVLEED